MEQDLRLRGFRQLCVPPPSGMYEYFMQRGFEPVGATAVSGLLPEARRAQLGRQQLFCKELLPASEGVLPAGKRIGF